MPIRSLVPPSEASTAETPATSGSSCFTGSCLCRSVTYELSSLPFNVVLCHCVNCSKASGSAFQYNGFFRRTSLHIISGLGSALKTFQNKETDSGNMVERNFCGFCGSHLFTINPTVPDLVIVMAGTIDGKLLDQSPREEFYCKRKFDWMQQTVTGSKRFEGME